MKKRNLFIGLTVGLIVGIFSYHNFSSVQSQSVFSHYKIISEQSLTQAPNAEAKPLTLNEAWDIVQSQAEAWSEDALLISLESSDIADEGAETSGQDGRRRTWHAVFTSLSLNKQLYLQVTDGRVGKSYEDGIHDPIIPTIIEKPTVDSPELLEQAKIAKPGFSVGIGTGKGYHFILETGSSNKPTITVVGSYQVTGASRSPALVTLDLEADQVEAKYYSVAPTGGILFSTDSGSNWQASNLTEKMINSIAKDLSNPGLAYAVVSEVEGVQLYKTEDGGQNWRAVTNLPAEAGNWAYDMLVANNIDGETYLLIGTTSGLWFSSNENDWSRIESLPARATQWLALLRTNDDIKVFASSVSGPNAGALYSSNDLVTWNQEADTIFRLSEAFDYQAVAATDEAQSQAIVFGETGQFNLNVPPRTLRLAGDFIGDGPLVSGGADGGRRLSGDRNTDTPNWNQTLTESAASLAASPNLIDNPILLAGGFRTGIFQSQDGGSSWINVLPNPSRVIAGSNDIHGVLFLTNEEVIAINGGRFQWIIF